MLQKNIVGLYQSSIFSSIEGLVHGFSTRAAGDMRSKENRKHVLQELSELDPLLVLPEQIHGVTVMIVSKCDGARGADALVYHSLKGVALKGSPVVLGVLTADCVPLLAVDPVAQIIGVAHAGWKGTVGGIATRLVASMRKEGAKTDRILVSVGPHIGMCCYDVPDERAQRFLIEFNENPKVVSEINNAWHVDIGYANFLQLKHAGIALEHIDAPPTCTKCQRDEFFSYRRDTKETFGEMLGVIGYRA